MEASNINTLCFKLDLCKSIQDIIDALQEVQKLLNIEGFTFKDHTSKKEEKYTFNIDKIIQLLETTTLYNVERLPIHLGIKQRASYILTKNVIKKLNKP